MENHIPLPSQHKPDPKARESKLLPGAAGDAILKAVGGLNVTMMPQGKVSLSA